MIVNYDFLGGIGYSSTVKYNGQIKTSGSPILFPQDILYRVKDILEGVVPHLLSVTQEHHGPLHDLLCKYHNIFLR